MSVRVGVIGVGSMGQDHVRRLSRAVSGARVVAVADVDLARAQAVARGVAGARAVPSGEEVIEAEDVDGVLVASWGGTHESYVLAAIAAGKPALCEKPLAPEVDACLRIVDAEVAAGRRLVQVGFMRRYDPAYLALKESLAAGDLGVPLMVHCRHRNREVPPHYAGGMPITDTAVHEIDVVRWLLEDEIVAARVLKPRKTSRAKADLQDPLLVLLEMGSGAIVDVEVFVNLPYGYDIRCEVVCELGTVALGEEEPLVVRKDGTRSVGAPEDYRERFRGAYDRELQAWVDGVAAGQVGGPSAWDGYAATAVADACLAALERGERIGVRMQQRPALYQPDEELVSVGGAA